MSPSKRLSEETAFNFTTDGVATCEQCLGVFVFIDASEGGEIPDVPKFCPLCGRRGRVQ